MIQLTEKDYHALLEDRRTLMALEAAGVDNWEGYETALELIAVELANEGAGHA